MTGARPYTVEVVSSDGFRMLVKTVGRIPEEAARHAADEAADKTALAGQIAGTDRGVCSIRVWPGHHDREPDEAPCYAEGGA
jgi:hypothetical protein